MIRVEVLDSSPVYLCGLAQVLPRDGIEIVGMRCVPYDELALAADVYLMDACALQVLGEEASLYVFRAVQQHGIAKVVCDLDFIAAGISGAGSGRG